MLRALVERRIGRRDQANAWIWRLAEYTRDVHEEYAVQRWPETKRLLGLLVNSAGGAHARNARRLVHAARKQDRRLAAALLAAALAHTPEAEEVLRGARTRMARKPPALARELLRNFPKRRGARHAPPAQGSQVRRSRRRSGDLLAVLRARRARARRRSRERLAAGRGAAPMLSRWTSPARSSVWPPSSSATRSRPLPSMPAAVPCPPFQLIRLPFRASRARQASSVSDGVCSSLPSSASSSRASTGSSSCGSRPMLAAGLGPGPPGSGWAPGRSSGGRSSSLTATFRPIPSTAHPC